MSIKKSSEIPKYEKLSKIITEIKNKGNFSGVILSYLDGRLLVKSTIDDYNFEEFIPMIASVLKSADGIGKTIGGRRLQKIIAQLEDISLMILKSKENNVFLTLIIDDETNIDPILENIDEYFKKIYKYC
ncbi:MAG: roadblock/LC7 domain-containing protein [Candidatus Lokiarchaeota archaeon]|nr:roadblock/LC7 domain-containing protein [Candidatus Lokiarchaeota archaeon]